MESHTLMTYAATLFGIAVVGGVLKLGMRLVGMSGPPEWLDTVNAQFLVTAFAVAALNLLQ